MTRNVTFLKISILFKLFFYFWSVKQIHQLKNEGNMEQEKNMNEKTKRTRKPKAKDEALPVEQITELMLVYNKNDPKAGMRVVSEIGKDGKVKTVPADEQNENSFLKFDKNSSILENFIRNFWSQLKNPSHFRLLRMSIHDYKMNKQAIQDMAEGKQTDAVKKFLERYEIRPKENKEEQSTNQKEKNDNGKENKATTSGTPAAE